MKKLITSATVLAGILAGILIPGIAAADPDPCPPSWRLGHGFVCSKDIPGQGNGNTGNGSNIKPAK